MSRTVRVHNLSKELGIDSREIVERCQAEGFDFVKNHMAVISLGLAESIREWFNPTPRLSKPPAHSNANPLRTSETIARMSRTLRVHNLAKELGIDSKEIVERCQAEGFDFVKNHMAVISGGLAESIREWFHSSPGPSNAIRFIAPETTGREKPIELFERIEIALHDTVLTTLNRESIASQTHWWYDYIPVKIRIKCATRQEEENGDCEKQAYWDFIDLKEIIEKNWKLFQPAFTQAGTDQSKTKALAWMDRMNSLRRFFGHPLKAHVSKRKPSVDDVSFMREHLTLIQRIYSLGPDFGRGAG